MVDSLVDLQTDPATSVSVRSGTVQVDALGDFTGGPPENISETTRWTSSDSTVASVSEAGLVTTTSTAGKQPSQRVAEDLKNTLTVKSLNATDVRIVSRPPIDCGQVKRANLNYMRCCPITPRVLKIWQKTRMSSGNWRWEVKWPLWMPRPHYHEIQLWQLYRHLPTDQG